MRLDAPLLGPVGVDVAIVERGDRVPALNRLFDAPEIDPRAATSLGRPVVHDALASFRHPVRGQAHRRVPHQGVVAKVVQGENDRCWALPAVGNDQHQVNRRQLGRPEPDGHFPERCPAAQRVAVFALDLAGHFFGRRRQEPVHVVLEQGDELGPALIEPLLARADAPSIGHDQRIRELRPRREFGHRRKPMDRRQDRLCLRGRGNPRETRREGHAPEE